MAEPTPWKPIETAPKDASWILVLVNVNGIRHPVAVHWAHGGGEDQPPFGPGWFKWDGYGFSELPKKPTHWTSIPDVPRG